MKNQVQSLIILVISIVIYFTTYGQEKLAVEGAIIIKNSEDPTPEPGTIRFNPATNDFEGWNGVIWASLTGGLGSVTDIDANVYKTVTIGTQVWMAQNLRTTRYENGDTIPNVTDNTEWSNLDSGAYCWYNNDDSYEQPYGKLYNWYAVNDSRGLCPTGWHVPSGDDISSEWKILIDYLGGLSVAGGPMKEAGIAHWMSPNTGATNSSGFTGLPGGYRILSGTFNLLGARSYWWSSTESGSYAWYRNLNYDNDDVSRNIHGKEVGLSVRCVRD
jgi:uncharacterized protein (TIGR02145 family)